MRQMRAARPGPLAVLSAKNLTAGPEIARLAAGARFYPLEDWFEGIECK